MSVPVWCMAVARVVVNDPDADERLVERIALSIAVAAGLRREP